MHIVEIECKSVLNRKPGETKGYTLNAYQGCAFACSYCYVPVIRNNRGQVDALPWGEWMQVKVNAPEVLAREVQRVKPDAKIMIGTAADSWQPVEKRYEISRRILQRLTPYPNHVTILTRSPLITRDIDVLCAMQDVSVGVSLPTFDDRARRVFEPKAPSVAARAEAVRKLVDAGLNVSLACCPLLYGVSDNLPAIEQYMDAANSLGVKRVWFGVMNYTEVLAKPHMQLLRTYRQMVGGPSPRSLARIPLKQEVQRLALRYGMEVTV